MNKRAIPIGDYEHHTHQHECAFRLVTVSERRKQTARTGSHVVKGVLRTGSVAAIQARPGCGKTALAVHLAKCLLDGSPFMERETKQAAIVYVAAEDEDDVAARLEAIAAEEVLIAQLAEGFSSQKPQAVSKLISDIALAARNQVPDRPVVMFIDTLRAALGDGSVMEDRVVSPFLNALRRAAEQNDICIIVLHHTNRENTRASKGETLESVVVCEIIMVEGSDSWVNIEIGKNRNGPGRRQIGRTRFGSRNIGEAEVAVIEEIVADESVSKSEDDDSKGMGSNQRRVMTIIDNLLSDVTEKIRPFGLEGLEVYAVSEKAIIDEYVSVTAGDMPNKKREACVRALNALIGRGLIAKRDLTQGSMVWLVKE